MTSIEYDDKSPVDEPIEVRLRSGGYDSTYVGSVNGTGVIAHVLVSATGTPDAMGNVQSKGGHYPLKAVPGWQAEMVAWFKAGLRDIVEIR